ncbi:hypothetical protein L1987_18688 [Smallanthus sonchifolius]|uniref:Uncharacterized protein n=1 Tax=Smallanthus sonchifolius TaxID=185202 RepID=A0ACB9J0R9_9ASTR|nr:hypothetical protein L1987_18688 [Smallanthus sonchifolius]
MSPLLHSSRCPPPLPPATQGSTTFAVVVAFHVEWGLNCEREGEGTGSERELGRKGEGFETLAGGEIYVAATPQFTLSIVALASSNLGRKRRRTGRSVKLAAVGGQVYHRCRQLRKAVPPSLPSLPSMWSGA